MASAYISQAVIKRLPRYMRFLSELKAEGIDRISSKELSERMHVTASQIRQDLNHFGGFGQQGYGYNVAELRAEIAHILGIDLGHRLIIVGAGHLGHALLQNFDFAKAGDADSYYLLVREGGKGKICFGRVVIERLS